MNTETKSIDLVSDEIIQFTREYVDKLGAQGSDPYFREAVIKFAIREFSWALVETFDSRYEISDQLELMAQLVKSHDPNEGTDGT